MFDEVGFEHHEGEGIGVVVLDCFEEDAFFPADVIVQECTEGLEKLGPLGDLVRLALDLTNQVAQDTVFVQQALLQLRGVDQREEQTLFVGEMLVEFTFPDTGEFGEGAGTGRLIC